MGFRTTLNRVVRYPILGIGFRNYFGESCVTLLIRLLCTSRALQIKIGE